MKPDERVFLSAIRNADDGVGPDETASRLGMAPKRAAYILSKWTDRGWYEYGVNVMHGWLTDEGREAADAAE